MGKKFWNLSHNIVVMRFPPLAGGRFLFTMLSYFDKFIFPGPLDVMDIREDPNFSDEELKTLYHHFALRSVPHRDVRHFWPLFETGVRRFWGFRLMALIDNYHYSERATITLPETWDLMPRLSFDLLDRYHGFHTVHESSYEELKSLMPNCKIVNLIEADQLQEISSKFKPHHWKSSRKLPDINGEDVINFSMKNVFDKQNFFNDVAELAYKISGNNNFDPRIEEYYDRYYEIHQDE